MRIVKWCLTIIFTIIIIVLVLDNTSPVVFNLIGIYHVKLPIIVLCIISLIIGMLIGSTFSAWKYIKLKLTTFNLKKKLKQIKSSNQ
jgi:uncharacterized integral membrane protein